MEAQTSVVADDVQEFLAHRTFTVCEHTFLRARSHVLADSQTPLSSFMALSTHVGWEDPLEEGMATHSSILAWRIPMHRGAWQATVHGVAKRWARPSFFHSTHCFCGDMYLQVPHAECPSNAHKRSRWHAPNMSRHHGRVRWLQGTCPQHPCPARPTQ